MKAKLTSRKFWLAIITIISGIVSLLGFDDSAVKDIVSALLILVPSIVYIFTEGRIDAAALQKIDIDALGKAIVQLMKDITPTTVITTVPAATTPSTVDPVTPTVTYSVGTDKGVTSNDGTGE